MKYQLIFLLLSLTFILSGCTFDPYQKSKFGEIVVDAWFSDDNLGDKRKEIENIDEIVSRQCQFVESKKNKYVFSCKIIYKEKGETVIPLSKNSTIKVYAIFMKESGNKYAYKVYNSSSVNKVWNVDTYLDY